MFEKYLEISKQIKKSIKIQNYQKNWKKRKFKKKL